MEAIKLAKKRTGRVTRREIKMTIDMARAMIHSRNEMARAKRLLQAVLPHAVSLEIIELEQEIISLLENIENRESAEPVWKSFLEKMQRTAKSGLRKIKKENKEQKEEPEQPEQNETPAQEA